jgi:hypothetical protein
MTQSNSLGFGTSRPLLQRDTHTEHVMVRRPLQRLLAFRGHSIDDVVNNPIVKNEVLGYWKVFRQIERRTELLELERQWNHLGQRL